jgi:ubiquitin C-terminal hydrolase
MASVAIHDSINLAALADTHIPASELQYILTGVLRHAGGHFTADFLEESQWYHADDAVVTPIGSPVKIGPEPYILVYQRSF